MHLVSDMSISTVDETQSDEADQLLNLVALGSDSVHTISFKAEPEVTI